MSADFIADHRLLDEGHPLTPEQRALCRAQWERLRRENARFRVIGPGFDLVSAPLSVFDELLVSHVEKDRWRKAARVIGLALGEFCDDARYQTGDQVLASRLQALTLAGRIEARGNLAHIRRSEVRLPPADAGAPATLAP